MILKKGQKELGMIFGLFILLIITLVVLGIFFKAAKQTDKVSGAGQDYFKEADKEKARSECESLCSRITDENTAIEFCKTVKKVDFNGDNTVPTTAPVQWGKWLVCEDKVPCFVLAETCAAEKGYGTKECSDILRRVNKDSPTIKFDKKGEIMEALNAEACDDTQTNWVGTDKFDLTGFS